MHKLVVLLLGIYSSLCISHDPGTLIYNRGIYKSGSFEYPASLTEGKIEYIVGEINLITKHRIIYIEARPDLLYDVMVCAQMDEVMSICQLGDLYIFGQGKKSFSNFTINTSSLQLIIPKDSDGINVESREYSKGVYANVPFFYPSSLSEKNIDEIVIKIKEISDHEILSISITTIGTDGIDDIYKVLTCSGGARIKYLCQIGEEFKYNLKIESIIIPREPNIWIQ